MVYMDYETCPIHDYQFVYGGTCPKCSEETKNIVYRMSYDSHGSKGPGVYCMCGSYKAHRRGKVLVAWAKKHAAKTGHLWKGQP